jgi:SPP1 gp7 family putative phage head morphogenesis protein
LDKRVAALVTAVAGALRDYEARRADSSVDELQAVLALVERVGVAHESTFIGAGPRSVQLLGTELTQWQDRATARFLGDVAGLNPRKIGQLFKSNPLDFLLNSWAANNVVLIQGAEASFLDDVQAAVVSGLVEGKSLNTIAQTIEQRGNVARSRARLIARDQVATLNGQIAQERQKSLGVTEYRWTTSLDERVRPEHAERHNRVFKWSEPPRDGHPGRPINCRCVATPIIPKSLDLFNDD